MARSKQQTECISTSATEAEFVALHYCSRTVMKMRQLLSEFGFEQLHPTQILEDCKSAVSMASTLAVNNKSAHINVKFNSIKDLCARGLIKVSHVNRPWQRSDFLAGRQMTPTQFKGQNLQLMRGVLPKL